MATSLYAAICRYWIWLGVPLALALLLGLILMIRGLVELVREPHIARMPLAESLEINFPSAGPVVLNTESRRFSRGLANAKFQLRDLNGELVPGQRVSLGMSTQRVSTITTEHTKYEIAHPGRYVLWVEGIRGNLENEETHWISFDRPHGKAMVGFILGILFFGITFVLSLVAIVWRVLASKMQS